MDKAVIPHSRPSLDESDIRAVATAMKSGHLSQGRRVQEFEKRLAGFIGKKNAAATSSGTAALHLALMALDIKERDEVIIPSFVCSALLNAIHYTRATPVLVDIEPLTFNLSADAVKRAVTRKTKAIIVPHLFGCPAQIDRLTKLGIPLIEDCAQAIGATFKGRRVGSIGLLSVFSFYATKVITSGEGGMVLSDSKSLISKIKDLRDYDNKNDYLLRYNYKMNDIQAALGLSQLARLDEFIARRREIATLYFREFKNCHFSLPPWKEENEHIYYRFVVRTEEKASVYLEKLRRKKVQARRPVYIPLHVYMRLSGFPRTMAAWQKSLSIPLYPSLKDKDIKKIIAVVKDIF
jgi:dTDP-4-amino-4,6-dideoxygalactose transaminase